VHHRPRGGGNLRARALNTRLDLLPDAIRDLVEVLYVELHRAADGGVGLGWLEPGE